MMKVSSGVHTVHTRVEFHSMVEVSCGAYTVHIRVLLCSTKRFISLQFGEVYGSY